MLWDYTQILIVVAMFFTLLGFWKRIDPFMRVVFIYISALCWNSLSYGLLKITYKWAGSSAVISYTYIPDGESAIAYIFFYIGIIFAIIASVRAIDLFQARATGERWLGD